MRPTRAVQIAFFIAASTHDRTAFVALVALIVCASIPLAYAWARVLPEDAPPFKIEPGSFPSVDIEPAHPPAKGRKADLISLALLVCVTLTYLARFPGIPVVAITQWIQSALPGSGSTWLLLATKDFLVIGTGLAACIATVRPGPMRVPLVVAAAMALTMWLLVPILQSAMLST